MGGAIPFFRVAGIEVSIHFSWFIIAAYQLAVRPHGYESKVFAAYEYLALFGIVLIHEFGHALACRQTGGEANRIMLWPLGGVAFVRPPARPGAELWSIAAGPLVNVALIPVLELLRAYAEQAGWAFTSPDTYRLIEATRYINLLLLIFNMLPIYPLDGGQILRSLLWFPLGRIRSLQIASALGIVGAVAGGAAAYLWRPSIWMVVLAFFLLSQALSGWQAAKQLAVDEDEARRVAAERDQPPFV